MKKRVLALLLAGAMALGMTACSGSSAPETSGDAQAPQTEEGQTGSGTGTNAGTNTGTNTGSGTGGKGSAPNTGDHAPILPLILLLGVSGIVLLILGHCRKRRIER